MGPGTGPALVGSAAPPVSPGRMAGATSVGVFAATTGVFSVASLTEPAAAGAAAGDFGTVLGEAASLPQHARRRHRGSVTGRDMADASLSDE